MITGESHQELRRRGRGHHHRAVGALDEAASRIDTGDEDLADIEIIECNGRTDDIDDGIRGTYLMEMYGLRREPCKS